MSDVAKSGYRYGLEKLSLIYDMLLKAASKFDDAEIESESFMLNGQIFYEASVDFAHGPDDDFYIQISCHDFGAGLEPELFVSFFSTAASVDSRPILWLHYEFGMIKDDKDRYIDDPEQFGRFLIDKSMHWVTSDLKLTRQQRWGLETETLHLMDRDDLIEVFHSKWIKLGFNGQAEWRYFGSRNYRQ